MKERNNSRSARVISKNPIDIVSRDASASMRNKAWGLFCPPLWSVAHYRGRGGGVTKKKPGTMYLYIIAHILCILHLPRQEQTESGDGGRCWPWIGSLIPSSSNMLFHRSAALRCEMYVRVSIASRKSERVRERERERERDKTGKWEEKGNLKSLLHSSEKHSHDMKAKEGHALHPNPFCRLLNVNT